MSTASTEKLLITERCCRSQNDTSNELQGNRVFDCIFHPTQPVLACGLLDGSVQFFRGRHYLQPFADWERDDEVTCLAKRPSAISTLSWNTDGTRLTAGGFDGTVIVWKFPRRDSPSFESRQHPMAVFSVIWNRWNRHLFATRSRNEGVKQTIIAWNASDHDLKVEQTFELETKFVLDFEWVSDTRLAACSFEGDIHVFKIHEPVAVRCLSQPGVQAVRWHSASHLLASCGIDGTIQAWSLKDYTAVRHEFKWDVPACSIDCFGHRTGRYSLIACGLDDGSIVIWYLTNGRAYQLDGHVDAVVDVCFSPDGRFLASMDPEEKIIVWCTTDWRIECEYLKPLEVEWKRLSWSSDSKKLAVASRTEKVTVIDAPSEG